MSDMDGADGGTPPRGARLEKRRRVFGPIFRFSVALFIIAVVMLGLGLAERIDHFAPLPVPEGQITSWPDPETGEMISASSFAISARPVTNFLILLGAASLISCLISGVVGLIGGAARYVTDAAAVRARPLDVIVALAIVAVGFQGLASSLFAVLLDTMLALFDKLPNAIAQALAFGGAECSVSEAGCFSTQLQTIFQPVITVAQNIVNLPSLRNFAGSQLVVALALWSLLIWFFSSARGENSWWRRLSGTQKRTGAYLGLTVFSSYLGISALLAFAVFDGGGDSSYSDDDFRAEVARLDALLTGIHRPETRETEQPARAAPTLRVNRIGDKAETAVVEARQDEADETATPDDYLAAKAGAAVAGADAVLLDARFEATRKRADDYADMLVDIVVKKFDTANQNRLGVREVNDHAARLTDWFARQSIRVKDAVERCQAQIEGRKIRLAELMAATDPINAAWMREEAARVRSEPIYDCANSSYVSDFDKIPPRTAFGASLGLVGQWTSWLLISESTQLSLIVGLIGFGLLGATASNYFRDDYATHAEENWSAATRETRGAAASAFEVSSVFVKGFVAAIVVYLTATGGLAIIGESGSAEPNPYIVFASCLVGAVFSDQVWAQAKRRFFGDGEAEREGEAGEGI